MNKTLPLCIALILPACGDNGTVLGSHMSGGAGGVAVGGSGSGGVSGLGGTGSSSGGSSAGNAGKGNAGGASAGTSSSGGSSSGGSSAGSSSGGNGGGGGVMCPPCAAPPSPDCVGTGPCGCGPYDCPEPTECTFNDPDGVCGPMGLSCGCCGVGGPQIRCLCTTSCTSDADCDNPTRPFCSLFEGSPGICTPVDFGCCACPCTSPDTPIATPSGERPIAELRTGDLVYSVDGQGIVAVPVRHVGRQRAIQHSVRRVELEDGTLLEISARHPTADGRTFADLYAGAELDGKRIVRVNLEPYQHPFTYDILPDSSTGTYFAGGALIGSTLMSGMGCGR